MASTARRTADQIINTIRAHAEGNQAALIQRLEGALRSAVLGRTMAEDALEASTAADTARLDHLIEGAGGMALCDWEEPNWIPSLKFIKRNGQTLNARAQIDADMHALAMEQERAA